MIVMKKKEEKGRRYKQEIKVMQLIRVKKKYTIFSQIVVIYFYQLVLEFNETKKKEGEIYMQSNVKTEFSWKTHTRGS